MTIGILPVAGKATRIQGLPKYLLPVPGGYLLERMLARMAVPCYIGANTQNAALLDTYKRTVDTVYTVDSRSMPETIALARDYTGAQDVLVGMPDCYWTDERVFEVLSAYLDSGYICAIAAFTVSAAAASRLGACAITAENNVSILTGIEDKQPQNTPREIWGALAWRAEFWRYVSVKNDAHMGHSLVRAIADGVKIPVYSASGNYYDNGTPEDYFRCIRELTEGVHAAH